MNFSRHDRTAVAGPIDRRIIQVELPSDSAGVVAALRRAFDAALPCPSEDEFDRLLRRLN